MKWGSCVPPGNSEGTQWGREEVGKGEGGSGEGRVSKVCIILH